ncbi:MAG: endolytic transglycosylase MltG, partial [Chloroflexi bacterium]|nr:endolytic transglycosylase MltG [Chloroflexota bacterium]
MIALVLAMGSRPVSGDRTPVRVVIAKGATASDIAQVLSESGVLRSPFVFRLSCRMNGSGNKLKPGVFELNRAMSVPVIIDKLVNGESLELWVTLPEGFTVRQVADELASKQLADGDTFTRLAMSEGYDFTEYRFINGENLEGYLFPDTYLVGREMDPEAIIKKMLDTFGKKVAGPLRPRITEVSKARFGLNEYSFAEGLHRILTMASLVEREAKIPKDRPLIAAVLWNRLDKNMKLEVCATVSYRPGESTNNKSKVYLSDLQVDSPYNTYVHAGLPP